MEDEKHDKSAVSTAFTWVMSFAWKRNVMLRMKELRMAAKDFKTNDVYQHHVEDLKTSLLLHGIVKQATAPLHAVCFLRKFSFFSVFFFLIYLLFLFYIAEGMDEQQLTLEKAYKLGVYVFIGQHETTALKQLEVASPHNVDYRYRRFGSLIVFSERSEKVLHFLRMAGNFQNDLQDMRVKRTWHTVMTNVRNRYELGGCIPFTTEIRVIFL